MSDNVLNALALFASSDPAVHSTYKRIVTALSEIGPFTQEPKKTSIHLVRKSGFAGIHPRKRSLILNLRTARPIASPRISKVEQVSTHRYHNEIKLEHPAEVNAEVLGWLREAYELGD